MPDATEFTVHIFAAMAQHERKLISQRTKDALAPLKGTGRASWATLVFVVVNAFSIFLGVVKRGDDKGQLPGG